MAANESEQLGVYIKNMHGLRVLLGASKSSSQKTHVTAVSQYFLPGTTLKPHVKDNEQAHKPKSRFLGNAQHKRRRRC